MVAVEKKKTRNGHVLKMSVNSIYFTVNEKILRVNIPSFIYISFVWVEKKTSIAWTLKIFAKSNIWLMGWEKEREGEGLSYGCKVGV